MTPADAMPSNDFNLIDGLSVKIADKEERQGPQSLTEQERTVDLIWRASGLIGNGGFQYFYEQEIDAETVAKAYENIGCHKCAEILRLSLSLFPDSIRNAGWDERVEYMKQKKELFYNTSSLFWDADAEMEKRLADYVRANADNICQ